MKIFYVVLYPANGVMHPLYRGTCLDSARMAAAGEKGARIVKLEDTRQVEEDSDE